jgi:hypothetical protein
MLLAAVPDIDQRWRIKDTKNGDDSGARPPNGIGSKSRNLVYPTRHRTTTWQRLTQDGFAY